MNLLPSAVQEKRLHLSAQFLAGEGVEIGALHSPLWVSRRGRVKYVDRLPADELRRQYPELALCELVDVDIIDDGERLATISDNSLDFIIANHMLEHCENPLGAMRNHLAKLKDGGCLYYAVPDKRFSTDANRALTDFDHLVQDDREGPEWSRVGHFHEWATLVENAKTEADAALRVKRLMDMNYSIHFHVWDADRFQSIIEQAYGYLGRTFSTDWLESNETEVIAVLRKSRPGNGRDPSQRLRSSSFSWKWRSLVRHWEFRLGAHGKLLGALPGTEQTGALTNPMRFWIDEPASLNSVQPSPCRFTGWVVSEAPGPVTVRARYGDRTFEGVTTLPRPDVVAAFGGPSSVPNLVCGFTLDVDLPKEKRPVEITLEFDDHVTLMRTEVFTVEHQ